VGGKATAEEVALPQLEETTSLHVSAEILERALVHNSKEEPARLRAR
jgi:hypothetical protein